MTPMREMLREYQTSGTAGATHLDLILAVYDALAQDLNRMGDAIGANDIEGRCRVSRHALLLLGYLESWIVKLQEPELERSLVVFYSFLRAEIMRLQAHPVTNTAHALAMMVCETRAAWQQKRASVRSVPGVTVAATDGRQSHAQAEGARLGWSA